SAEYIATGTCTRPNAIAPFHRGLATTDPQQACPRRDMSRPAYLRRLRRTPVARVQLAVDGRRHGVGLLLGGVFGATVVQGLEAASEHLGRASLVAAAVLERGEDGLALHRRERGADGKFQAVVLACQRSRSQLFELDQFVGHDESALHAVPELAHVTRP